MSGLADNLIGDAALDSHHGSHVSTLNELEEKVQMGVAFESTQFTNSSPPSSLQVGSIMVCDENTQNRLAPVRP